MYMDGPKCVSPVKTKKGSNITILKRGERHYEIRVPNQLHKNYFSCLYQIPLRTTNVFHYVMLAIHESNAPFPVKSH